MAEVSVIMPAFNVAPYIGASIESVIAQTAPDWELLIVDDGSTDTTAQSVEAYAAKDPRVRLIRQVNRGISAARNRALRESTGAFIATLDSDDIWEPNFLEVQLAVFARQPEVDVVTGNGWFLGGRWHGSPARPYPDPRPQPTLATMLADETAIFIMSIMRRRVYSAVGEFDETLITNEDYDFWLRAAAAGFKFARNDEPLGHYRRRSDSMSANHVRMVTGILQVYEKMRSSLIGRPNELRVVEEQVARFQRARLTAQALDALNAGEGHLAADHLDALYAQGGRPIVKVAGFMARWMPRLLSRAYQLRRARQGAAS